MRTTQIILFLFSTLIITNPAFPALGSINYSTGQLTFSKTITTARGHKLSLPVNLTYNSRLTRNQHPSWVGFGYDLDLPYIERTVRGGPDDRLSTSADFSKYSVSTINGIIAELGLSSYSNPFKFDWYCNYPLVSQIRIGHITGQNAHGMSHLPYGMTAAWTQYWANGTSIGFVYAHAYNDAPIIKPLLPFGVGTQPTTIPAFKDCFQNQTQQDVYALHNFPAGDRQLYFSGATKSWVDNRGFVNTRLAVNVSPAAPWQIQYYIDTSATAYRDTLGVQIDEFPAGQEIFCGTISKWVILDENGVEYTFSTLVKAGVSDAAYDEAAVVYLWDNISGTWKAKTTNVGKHNTKEYVKRWYLTKIASPDATDSIVVEYDIKDTVVAHNDQPYFNSVSRWNTSKEVHVTANTCSDVLVFDTVSPPQSTQLQIPLHTSKLRLKLRIENFDPDTIVPEEPAMPYLAAKVWILVELDATPEITNGCTYNFKSFPSSQDTLQAVFHYGVYGELEIDTVFEFLQSYNCRNSTAWLSLMGTQRDTQKKYRFVKMEPYDTTVSYQAYANGKYITEQMVVQKAVDSSIAIPKPFDWYIGLGDSLFLESTEYTYFDVGFLSESYARMDSWQIGVPGIEWSSYTSNHGLAYFIPPSGEYSRYGIDTTWGWDANLGTYRKSTVWYDTVITRVAQTSITNPSRKYVNRVTPRRIITPLEQVVFESGPAWARDEFGRKQLSAVVTKTPEGVERDRTGFLYSKSAYVNNALADTIWQLDSIELKKNADNNARKRLYKFHYANPASCPADNNDNFGTVYKGMIDTIFEVDGAKTVYEYEAGSYSYLSDGSAAFAPFGLRLKKVIEGDIINSKPVVTTISYGNGEVDYNPALAADADTNHNNGLLSSRTLCQQLGNSNLVFMLPGSMVHYQTINVNRGNTGVVTYTYLTANNDVRLHDRRDPYLINRQYRYRPTEQTVHNKNGSKVVQSKKTYYDTLFAKIDTVSGGLSCFFTKPQTHCQKFDLRSTGTGSYGSYAVNDTVINSDSLPGMPASMLVRSLNLVADSILTVSNNVRQTQQYFYNPKNGLLVSERKNKGTTSAPEALGTKYTYGADKYIFGTGMTPEGIDIANHNLVDLRVASTTLRYRRGSAIDSTVMSASASPLKQFNLLGTSKVFTYPVANYAWNVPRDSSATPMSAFNSYFDSHSNWQQGDSVVLRNYFGAAIETRTNNRTLSSSSVIRSDNDLMAGSITNGGFFESGIFTCDYDQNNGIYFDYSNGWEHGIGNSANSSPSTSVIDATVKHFGDATVHVVNAFGPTRNVKIEKDNAGNIKNYELSAWVKPAAGVNLQKNVVIGIDYRRQIGTGWPLNLVPATTQTPIACSGTLTVKGSGPWYFISLTVPASTDLASQTWNPGWYARLWVGVPNSGEIWIDDIRFAPKNAMVTSTYYDAKWRQPILSVDANNNSSQQVVYDNWGRPIEWYKINPNTLARTIRQKKEYHLMGE